MAKITFSMSPSSINLYKQSQLLFFYTYILKAKPDTNVIQCYGIAGSVVHNFLEEYAKVSSPILFGDVSKRFQHAWKKANLDKLRGFNGSVLSYEKYFNAAQIGIKLLNNIYTDVKPEESISWDVYEDEIFKIKIKGIIDVQAIKMFARVIMDYKTSSAVDTGDDFKRQGKHYCMLVYKKYGYVPEEVVFEYVKIGKRKSYKFTEQDLIDYEKEVIELTHEIVTKGLDESKYELGDFDTPFNQHLKKCVRVQAQRANEGKIVITGVLYNNRLYLTGISNMLRKVLDLKYSFFVEGHEWSNLFKRKVWDGKKHMFTKNSIPYGFMYDFIEILKDYSKHTGTEHIFKLKDKRTTEILSARYKTVFKSTIKLRQYQEDAVTAAIEKKVGIIYGGTSFGKTYTSGEIIKRLNRRTLFLVNRIELARQTQEEYEKFLGVKIGLMTEGELDITKQITVASIQTLSAILKRKDETSKKLELYMHNVTLCIYDEAQNLKNSGMYGDVSIHLTNNDYFIALSGSPWRADGSTLEMNALCGFPIYEYSTADLERDGWITPTKCIFINYETEYDEKGMDYQDVYKDCIVNGEERNKVISEIANKHKFNKKILILTKRVEHAHILNEMIPDSVVITGVTGKKYRKEMFKKFKETEGIVLIGSLKIFSAGIDIPNLDILINATGHKSSVDSIQTVGRLKRKAEGKKYGYFIDFIDRVPYLLTATHERKYILQKFKNDVSFVNDYNEINFE